MNYLAHLFLSGENREIQAGNLFGDEVKGRNYEHFPENIKIGLLLHRFIDSFTDLHQVNLDAKKLLYLKLGKYAGIALDIYYDHFLAKYWNEYSDINLNEYTLEVYQSLKPLGLLFSNKSQELLEMMAGHNWLFNYAELDGMERTFSGMTKRLGEDSGMGYAFDLLENKYSLLEGSFRDYFPELMKVANNKLLDLCSNPNK